MNERILNWASGCLVVLLVTSVCGIPTGAMEVKRSQLSGGEQYWWQAEDFESRDEAVMLLKDEPDNPLPDLPGAFGDQYVVFKLC